MQNASSEIANRYKTNMEESLKTICGSYTDTSKKMTLIVLTEGLWEGCVNSDDVEKLKARLKKWEPRWFSIQLVSFGDNKQAVERPEARRQTCPSNKGCQFSHVRYVLFADWPLEKI